MCGFFLWNITKGFAKKGLNVNSSLVCQLANYLLKNKRIPTWHVCGILLAQWIQGWFWSHASLILVSMYETWFTSWLWHLLVCPLLSALMSHFMDEASLTIRSACVTFYFHFLLFFKAKIFARRETEGKMASPIHISKPPRKPIWKEMKRVLNGTTNLFQAQIVKQTEYQKHLSSFPNFRLSLTLGIFQILGHQEFFWREKNHIILKV